MDSDLYFLKKKIDKGAEYITTQMFFENKHFYNFQEQCKQNGIQVPIIPGLKPLTTKKQLTIIPSIFKVEVPVELSTEIMKAKTEAACDQIGTEWLLAQCKDLLKQDTPILHFYTLGKPHIVKKVLEQLF
jgi:methylenetetrahydrofolate reductase (NADPH)